MNLPRYNFNANENNKQYEFFSEGPKGRIRKVVRFTFVKKGRISFYNLSFGDWNEENGDFDNSSVTNNGDAEKVLATVGLIVIHFIAHFNDAIVYAVGSNAARTRRYQIGINKMWNEIGEMFDVYGFTDQSCELFQKNVNYKGFLICRKEFLHLQEQTYSYMKSSNHKRDNKNTGEDFIDEMKIDNSPSVLKKIEEAKKTLDKIILPEELLKRFHRNR